MPLSEVRWIELPHVRDGRGVLTAIEGGRDVPFEIRRIFYVHGVVAERGGHAHRGTHQVLIPVAGSLAVDTSDGVSSATFRLADPNRGLYLPPMTWTRLYEFSAGAVMLVLADTHYERAQSLRTWDEFCDALADGDGG